MPSYNLTIDDSSPAFFFRGAWQDSTTRDTQTPKYSWGTFHATDVPGANVTLTFNGTAVTVYGAKRDNHGNYQASVDGNGAVINGYASPNIFQTPLFTAGGLLSSSEHTVFLSNDGTSTLPWFDVDHATLSLGDGNTDTQTFDTVMDDTHPNITYSGNDWGFSDASAPLASTYFNSSFHVTNTLGATATVDFYGNAIQIYGAVSNNHGAFSVALDGAPVIQLSGQSFTFHPQILLYQWSSLPGGRHTVVITSTSTNSSEYLDLDKFVVSRWETSTSSTSSAGSSQSTSDANNNKGNSNSNSNGGGGKSNTGLIVGVVVGVVALLAILGALLFFFLRRRKVRRVRNAKSPRDPPPLEPGRGPTPPNEASSSLSAPSMRQAYAPQGSYTPPSTGRISSAGLPYVPPRTSDVGGSSNSSRAAAVSHATSSTAGLLSKARDAAEAAAIVNPPQYDQIVNYNQGSASRSRPLPAPPS